MNIGIVGYSSHKIDDQIAKTLLLQLFQQLIALQASAQSVPIPIISGLTNIGIP